MREGDTPGERQLCLVTEFMEGGSLQAAIQHNRVSWWRNGKRVRRGGIGRFILSAGLSCVKGVVAFGGSVLEACMLQLYMAQRHGAVCCSEPLVQALPRALACVCPHAACWLPRPVAC